MTNPADHAEMIRYHEGVRDNPIIIVRWRGGKSDPVNLADAIVIASARHAEGYRVQIEDLTL